MIIIDPRTHDTAFVDSDHQLAVASKSSPLQHVVSESKEQAYQVEGETVWSAAAGAENVLHIKNTSTTHRVIVTYMRFQIVSDLTFPNVGTYFTVEVGETYGSGGTAVTAVNVNVGSANTAGITAYNDNPTLTGTSVQIDKHFPDANGALVTYNKEGSVILQPSQTIKVTFTPSVSHTGTAYARISFLMEEHNS